MRLRSNLPLMLAVIPLSLLASAGSGSAGVVTQTITGLSQSLGDFTPFDIDATPFDTALGTLTSVSVELIGTYTPAVDIDVTGQVPSSATLTSHLFVFATLGGPTSTFALGSQTLPVVAGPMGQVNSLGTAAPVDQIVGLTDLAAFETGFPTSQLLVEYGFRTSTSLTGSGDSDLTSFSGEAILTYDYASVAVPEPTTTALFATALLGVACCLRRSVGRG